MVFDCIFGFITWKIFWDTWIMENLLLKLVTPDSWQIKLENLPKKTFQNVKQIHYHTYNTRELMFNKLTLIIINQRKYSSKTIAFYVLSTQSLTNG